jgi:hypothetical protein
MKGQQIVDVAAAEIGYEEYPPNTNRTKYGEWFGYDGVMWCGIFVSWCFNNAGFPLGNIGFTKGFAGCQTAVAHFEDKGEITNSPNPGDIVFFDWNGDQRYDHTGIFVRMVDRLHFETIEGNTSTINNSNGGLVLGRIRALSRGVIFVHPSVLNGEDLSSFDS